MTAARRQNIVAISWVLIFVGAHVVFSFGLQGNDALPYFLIGAICFIPAWMGGRESKVLGYLAALIFIGVGVAKLFPQEGLTNATHPLAKTPA